MNKATKVRRIMQSVPREWKKRSLELNVLVRRARDAPITFTFVLDGDEHWILLGSSNQVQRFRAIVAGWRERCRCDPAEIAGLFILGKLRESSFARLLLGGRPDPEQAKRQAEFKERIRVINEKDAAARKDAAKWLRQFRSTVVPLHLITKEDPDA